MPLRLTCKHTRKAAFFYNIFKKEFNIGFGTVKTDSCSFCKSHNVQIKTTEDRQKKNQLMAEKAMHKRRASSFYELVGESRPGLLTLCFDHQQNLVCPKVPDQQAYYSRQLYTYNFTVVKTRPDKKLTPDNTFVYTRNENEQRKDSSACCSAVIDVLRKEQCDNINTVRLCLDGCGGQNKNSTLLYMAAHWLQTEAPMNVKNIELVFPVRGHSFLPCDRIFGLIEKTIRKKQCVFDPAEYHKIFQEYGQVRRLGAEWDVFDFKRCSDDNLKKPLPIKIQENKRFYISRNGRQGKTIPVAGEMFYRNRLNNPVKVTKKGKSFSTIPYD